MKIKCVGVDPSLTHTGISVGTYDLETRKLKIDAVHIVVTENETGKTVRRNSDDLRRCAKIANAIWEHSDGVDVVFSEIPTGAQSSRAAFAFGMVIGIFAGITAYPKFRPAFIQVLPQQVKQAIPGGSKVTSKEEIVHWAFENWPHAGWLVGRGKSKFEIDGTKLTADNEHMADSCAAINAGILTDDFRNLCAAFSHFSDKSRM